MTNRKKVPLLILGGGCALALVLALFPCESSVTEVDPAQADDPLCEAFLPLMEDLRDQRGDALTFGKLYVERERYLFRPARVRVTAPCLQAEVGDVGASGTTQWTFHLQLLSQTWEDGVPGEPRAVSVSWSGELTARHGPFRVCRTPFQLSNSEAYGNNI